MADAVVSFLIERLGDLLIEEAEVLHGVSDQFVKIQAELRTFRAILKDSSTESFGLDAWPAEVRELAYDASDVLESFVLDARSSKRHEGRGIKNVLYRYVCMLNEPAVSKDNIGSKIKTLKNRISELTTRLQMFGIQPSLSQEVDGSSFENSRGLPLRRHYNHAVVDPEVVGLEKDVKLLVAHLVNDEDKSYRLVSIYGMGGLGKTTLARKIHNHSVIKRHFACLAWVCISQQWKRSDILKAILLELGPDQGITSSEDHELVKKIFDIQNTKRCLVVLDDVWSNDVWDCLKAAFPAENKSSKILLTTRIKEVAEHVDSQVFLHQPQLLNEDQSWVLLLKKTCIKNDGTGSVDVKKMEVLGRELLKHCNGLPLGILVLGGILVTKPSLTEWERVHETMMSSLRSGKGMGKQHQAEVVEVLELSYRNLPYQLKLCFLYLGQFPEDAEIEAEKLYQLWMAEGFILPKDRRDGETMMNVAELYLGELVHRSMVQVQFEQKESSIRKFHSCRLHDLMRDLSLNKAEDEDFFKAVDIRRNSNGQVLVESSPSGVYSRRAVIRLLGYGDTGIQDAFLDKKDSGWLRSIILLHNKREMMILDHLQRFLSSHLQTFKLLKVLSLEKLYLHKMDNKFVLPISDLTNLRYFSLRDSRFPFVLPVINSEQLQTFDLRILRGARIPPGKDMLQNMGRLQHLYLPKSVNEKKKISKLRLIGSTGLEKLQNFDPEWLEAEDLYHLTNLQKLEIRVEKKVEDVEKMVNYLSSTSSSSLRYSTLKIHYCNLSCGEGPALLKQLFLSGSSSLHRLSISGNLGKLPVFENHVNFLSRLTKLSFYVTNLEKDPMPTLEKIPNLRHLKIGLAVSLDVKEMVCTATGFPQLVRLRLWEIRHFERWRVDKGATPNLSYLMIQDCPQLVMLPEGLRFLTALGELEIRYMPKVFVNRIQTVDDREGEDFYKVRHVPSVSMYSRDNLLHKFKLSNSGRFI